MCASVKLPQREITFHLYMHVARGQGRKLALHITSGSQELGALIGGPGTGSSIICKLKQSVHNN